MLNLNLNAQTATSYSSDLSVLPLLIKKYDNGKFTKRFLDGKYSKSIKLSKPRGRGLSLHEMLPGEIIFFAGGTGINPFCDTIDLLFK